MKSKAYTIFFTLLISLNLSAGKILEADRWEMVEMEFQVRDSETEEDIPAVSIAVNDSVYEADAQGILSLTILPGEYTYVSFTIRS